MHWFFIHQTHISGDIFSGLVPLLNLAQGQHRNWANPETGIHAQRSFYRNGASANPYTGEREPVAGVITQPNTYIQWNNYLKFFYPRHCQKVLRPVCAQYLFKRLAGAFIRDVIASPFGLVAISAWVAGFRSLKIQPFAEYHWNLTLFRIN